MVRKRARDEEPFIIGLEILRVLDVGGEHKGGTMKEQQKKSLARPLLPFGFASLLLVVLFCGLSQATEAEPGVLSTATSRESDRTGLLDCQPGVFVCEQTQNLVPNPGFEQGIGWPNYWYCSGDCTCQTDEPGHNSSTSARIHAGSARDEACMLFTPIDDIPVEPGRFYDYSAWMKTDLLKGNAYLRITFWSWREGPPGDWSYIGDAHTQFVTDTDWVWVKATGSVQAPADAERARIDAILPASSEGSVWFDDVFFSLATCLDISKSADPPTATLGELLTYTIAYSNTGREKATDVRIIETYDRDVDFEWAQPPPLTGTTTIWEIPELLPGARGTITVVVQVEDDAEPPSLVNCIQIGSDETVKPDYTCVPAMIPIDGCDVDIYPRRAERTVGPGDPTNYYLTLYNVGTCDGQAYLTYTSSLGWGITAAPSPPYTLPSKVSSGEVAVSSLVPRDALSGTIDVTSITATLVCSLPCTTTATATATLTTAVTAIPLTDVVISGPQTGTTNLPYSFTATVSPITATQPITYSWWATAQRDVVTNTHALSHTVVFNWQAPGTHIITVTAANAGDAVTDTHIVTITTSSFTVYLPLVLCCWPLIPPELHTIENGDIDGSYDVCWSDVACRADFYVLEEATDDAFADATEVCSTTDTCCSISGRGAGWYYYRVKACNSSGCSGWSNVEGVGAWWEHEDEWGEGEDDDFNDYNDSRSKANGPLISGEYYCGYPDDKFDYFKIRPDATGQVTMKLDNHTGTNVNLILYYGFDKKPVCSDNIGPTYEKTCPVIPGTYYICIRTDQDHNRDTPYRLRATFR
jgi:uncharacterized repeat protein (TIGR01451 family)